jgi:hypothetical protein
VQNRVDTGCAAAQTIDIDIEWSVAGGTQNGTRLGQYALGVAEMARVLHGNVATVLGHRGQHAVCDEAGYELGDVSGPRLDVLAPGRPTRVLLEVRRAAR